MRFIDSVLNFHEPIFVSSINTTSIISISNDDMDAVTEVEW